MRYVVTLQACEVQILLISRGSGSLQVDLSPRAFFLPARACQEARTVGGEGPEGHLAAELRGLRRCLAPRAHKHRRFSVAGGHYLAFAQSGRAPYRVKGIRKGEPSRNHLFDLEPPRLEKREHSREAVAADMTP